MKDKNKGYKPWKNYGGRFDNREKELEKQDALKKAEQKKKLEPLVNKLTDIVMTEHRKNALASPKGGRPQYMREDPTTPLIREVPFGPDTSGLIDHHSNRYVNAIPQYNENNEIDYVGDTRHYDIPSQNMSEFNKFEAEQNKLPPSKAFPLHFSNGVGFRVIPHGDISIPKEQKLKEIPYEKRDWEHGRLKSKAAHNRKKDDDAEAVAKEVMFNEGSSKLVNKKTGKIRPPKPVRSDYASIITAEHGFKGIIKEPTGFLVGEKNKPELVQVTPLTRRNML